MRKIPELGGAVAMSEEDTSHVLECIGWPAIIDAIATTFREEALNRVVSPPKVIVQVEKFNNDYRVMPSYMELYPKYCGSKVVCACPDNPRKHGLPLAMGTYSLNDAETQETLMVAGARTTTAWRTAAASAVGIRELNKAKGEVALGIVGCGHQAYFHIPAIASIANLKVILVTDVNADNMRRLQDHFIKDGSLPTVVCTDKEAVFKHSDVVVTMTPTTEPHIFAKDLPDREMVIAGIGGDSDRKIELSPEILSITDHYCDSYEQVSHTGVVMRAMDEGILKPTDLKSIGDYMVGNVKAGPERIKLFLSTGVALEDLIINILVYENRHLLEEK